MKLGFLASHRGSNMQAVIDACKSGAIAASPVVVISNNSDSAALQRAAAEGIAAYHISAKTAGTEEAADRKIALTLQEHSVDLVLLAGYMRKVGRAVLSSFPDRVINIHPALLPKYGGQGMYGDRVHTAVLENKDSETGVTIHLVNEEYDRGRILSQTIVPVEKDDDVASLSKRVLAAEHKLYTETLAGIIEGSIQL